MDVIPFSVRWLFLAFVFTLPYGATDLGIPGLTTAPKICGVFFFGLFLLYYGPLANVRSLPPLDIASLSFLTYLAFIALGVVFITTEFFGDFLVYFTTMAQMLLLFWSSSHLLKDERLAKNVSLVFLGGSSLFAILLLIPGVGRLSETTSGRLEGLNTDPGAVACNMVLGLILIIGLYIYRPSKKKSLRNLSMLLLAIPVLVVLIRTQSRGPILGFVAGLLVYWLPHARSRWVLSGTLGILLVGFTVYMIASSPQFVERWAVSYYEGNLAGREDLYAISADMIREKPLLGWHSVLWAAELGRREGQGYILRDAHNVWLALLLETGILGAIPCAIGFILCGRSAWKGRHASLGLVPMALFVSAFGMGLSGNILIWKQQWLILGLAHATFKRPRKSDRHVGGSSYSTANISRTTTLALDQST